MSQATVPPAALAVQHRLLQALSVLRILLLANAVGLNFYRSDSFVKPEYAIWVNLILIAWTSFMVWAYQRDLCPPWLLLSDLAVAVALLVSTLWLKGPDFRATVAGFWVAGALFAWAVVGKLWGGIVASVVLATTDLWIRSEILQVNYGNAFLLLVGGPIIGFLAQSLVDSAVEREQAERRAAVAAERARLARVVHDGVLQVLGLVQRRGRELGGEYAELAEAAGEQERRLRALMQQEDLGEVAPPDGQRDLIAVLHRVADQSPVSVNLVHAGPAMLVSGGVAEGISLILAECLTNVHRHAGAGAQAHVLIEKLADKVVLSVRDDGVGIATDRLSQAAAAGRLGVRESIIGRAEAMGGRAQLETGSWGTEWEITVPDPAR